jgi:hypothetical protein
VKRRQAEVSVNNAGERKVPQASRNMLVLVLVVESDPALRLWGFGEAACEREQAEPSRCFDVETPFSLVHHLPAFFHLDRHANLHDQHRSSQVEPTWSTLTLHDISTCLCPVKSLEVPDHDSSCSLICEEYRVG